MSDRLLGKVCIVTGGSSGIGAAIARLFLEQGASVMVTDVAPVSDAQLRKTMGRVGDRVAYRKADTSNENDVSAAVASAVTQWDGLHVAVACAGVPGQGTAESTTETEWDRTMAVNAKGVFLVSKYALPEMLKGGGGSIINISSVYALVGAPNYAAYCASKGAVRSFTKATAIDYATRGIRANSVHPGLIDTPLVEDVIRRAEDPGAMRALLDAQQPNGYAGKPEDIAWGCVYLASDESRFVSGCELVIDYALSAR